MAFIQKCGEALKALPYNTLELSKLKKYIDDQAQILGGQVQKTVPLNFITATLETCPCEECNQLAFSNSTSLLDPVNIVDSLLQFLCKINDEPLEENLFLIKQPNVKLLKSHALQICSNTV